MVANAWCFWFGLQPQDLGEVQSLSQQETPLYTRKFCLVILSKPTFEYLNAFGNQGIAYLKLFLLMVVLHELKGVPTPPPI